MKTIFLCERKENITRVYANLINELDKYGCDRRIYLKNNITDNPDLKRHAKAHALIGMRFCV